MPGADSPVVVDTNILFSALLRADSAMTRTLILSGRKFFICESVLVELYRLHPKIQRHTRLDEDAQLILLHQILRKVQVYQETFIPKRIIETARELCREVDPADTPMVALALTLDAWLWTGDRALRKGLEPRGFTSFFDPPRS